MAVSCKLVLFVTVSVVFVAAAAMPQQQRKTAAARNSGSNQPRNNKVPASYRANFLTFILF